MAKAVRALTGTISFDLEKKPEQEAGDATLVLMAEKMEVVDEQSDTSAAAIMDTCLDRVEKIQGFFKDMKSTAHQAHATICTREKETFAPYQKLADALKEKLRVYRLSLRESRKENQAVVDDEVVSEQSAMLKEAEQLFAAGQMSAGRKLAEQANSLIIPVMPSVGVSDDSAAGEREPWIWECPSLMDLVKVVASGKQPLMYSIKVRGKDGLQEEPLFEINPRVAAHLAKTHMDTLSTHFPGLKATQDLQIVRKKK